MDQDKEEWIEDHTLFNMFFTMGPDKNGNQKGGRTSLNQYDIVAVSKPSYKATGWDSGEENLPKHCSYIKIEHGYIVPDYMHKHFALVEKASSRRRLSGGSMSPQRRLVERLARCEARGHA